LILNQDKQKYAAFRSKKREYEKERRKGVRKPNNIYIYVEIYLVTNTDILCFFKDDTGQEGRMERKE
jgi:hypothetical protein